MLSGDEQVWRRTRHVIFEDLTLERDAGLVRRLIAVYAGEKAGLSEGGDRIVEPRDIDRSDRASAGHGDPTSRGYPTLCRGPRQRGPDQSFE